MDIEVIKIFEPKKNDEKSIEELLTTTINFAFTEQGVGHLADFINDEISSKMEMLSSFLSGNKETYFLIAKLDDKVVGIISFGKCGNTIIECCGNSFDNVGELGSLYVLPQFHGQGIGAKLIDSLISYMKSIGVTSFCLDSGYKNAQKKWVHKFGEPYKVVKDYWGPDADHYIWYCMV